MPRGIGQNFPWKTVVAVDNRLLTRCAHARAARCSNLRSEFDAERVTLGYRLDRCLVYGAWKGNI